MPSFFVRTVTLAALVSTVTVGLSAQALRVPGTSVTLAPPEGFSGAQNYPGFERADVQASIMVTELPVPAADMIRSMTQPALAAKGMTLISARDTAIKDKPARLLHVRQKGPTADVLKWMLIAGDTGTTVMMVGTFPEAIGSGVGDAIRRSLLTASWDAAGSPSPFEGLLFQVTPTEKLKLVRRVSNMLMFTESGTTGSSGSTEALFIAGQSLGQGPIESLRSFSESRAKQTTLTRDVTNFMGRAVQFAGLSAYELEADATDARSGRAMRLYQVIVLDEAGYFIFQGLIGQDRASEMFPEFRAVTKSFRRVKPQ